MLVIGNSHANCLMPVISRVMEGRFSRMHLYSHANCVPFANHTCPDQFESYVNAVRSIKPDVLMIIFRLGIFLFFP